MVKRTIRRARKPRRVNRRRRVTRMRRAAGVPEWASATEIMTLKTKVGTAMVPIWQSGIMYNMYNLSLSQFTRAAEIGKNYQFFRIKNVKLTFKPLADTFQAGAAGALPYLYYLIDKNGIAQNYTSAEQLKRSGAVPHRFDDKSIIVNYRPAVLEAVELENVAFTSVFNKHKISPWLTTSDNAYQGVAPWEASGVDHLGIKWCLESDTTTQYRIELQVEFQFKKALITAPPTGEALEVVEVFQTDGEGNGEFDSNIPA